LCRYIINKNESGCDMSQILETVMLVCFGLSWPINLIKNIKAKTAKATSFKFIALITIGYLAGIAAKLWDKKFNYVLAAYFINLVFVLANMAVYFINRKHDRQAETSKGAEKEKSPDRIHFLSTGSSDAILIESGSHFALVDCAEDSDNPRGFEHLNFKGYEQKVLSYLKKNASDKNGNVNLDLIIGTHSHSDHLGGFDTVIDDESVFVKKAILKKYDESKIVEKEVEQWDNKEVFEQTVASLERKNVPICFEPDEKPFKLGNLTLTLFNTEDADDKKVGENDRSLGVLIEKDGTRVFLAGDIDNKSADEDRIAPSVGKVNLLKVGHHSYNHSTTEGFLKNLMPDVCVITNTYKRADKNTLERIKSVSHSKILLTGEENGVIAELFADGKIEYKSDIH